MGDVDERIRFVLESLNAARVQGDLANTGKAIGDAGDKLELYTRRSQKAAALSTALSSALGSLTPELSALAGGAGKAAPAVEALTGLLGGGTGALVGAGLVGAIGVASAAMKLFGENEDHTRTSVQKLNVSLQSQLELIQKIDKAKLQKQLLSQGLAGTETQFAEVRRLESERDQITAALQRKRDEGVVDREFRSLQDRARKNAAALKEALKQLRVSQTEDIQDVTDEDEYAAADKRQTKREAAKQKAIADAAKNQAEIDKRGQEALARRNEYLTRQEQEEADRRDRLAAAAIASKKKEADAILAEDQRRFDAYKQMRERDAKDNEAADAKATANGEQRRKAGMAVYSGISGAASQAFAAIAAGEKLRLRERLRALGAEMVGEGTKFSLEGAAFLLLGNPAGAGLLEVGGLEIAAGAALAGATSGGGSRGGRSGGGGGTTTQTPASPSLPSRDRALERMAPVVVNYHEYPSIISPGTEDSRQMQRANDQRRREGR